MVQIKVSPFWTGVEKRHYQDSTIVNIMSYAKGEFPCGRLYMVNLM